MLLIGIDCATQPSKTGMALAAWSGAELRLGDADRRPTRSGCLDTLAAWVDRAQDVLLALDAPLGWPKSLGSTLCTHSAGERLPGSPDTLFSRATDRRKKDRLGKRPFEVGANLIARTAHAALELLADLRERTGHPIPLLWDPRECRGVGAIEVYPAATRIALGPPKKPIPVDGLAPYMTGDLSILGANPHVLDAAWCAVAGADFLAGAAEAPSQQDRDVAKREGWIWVRGREPGAERLPE